MSYTVYNASHRLLKLVESHLHSNMITLHDHEHSVVSAVVPVLVLFKSGARPRGTSMALRVSCLRSHVSEPDEL